ncbi:MAG: glycoside hydrolase family 65 protein [Acidimicrobiales bacterium]|nr:glycoside hydrolase family 65 protein [Acidimicrobiales bacterium]
MPLPFPECEPAWTLVVDGFDVLREREVESWLSVGNGVIGTRGSLEDDDDASNPGTYVAGAYVQGSDEGSGPELAPVPDWIRLVPLVSDTAVTLLTGTVVELHRALDLRHGVLTRTWCQSLDSGLQVWFRSARFASMADPQILVLWAELEADGAEAHFVAGGEEPVLREIPARIGAVELATVTRCPPGQVVRLGAVRRPWAGEERSAAKVLADADRQGVTRLFERHRAAWERRWGNADVVVEGDPEAQRALRFAVYHLISAGEASGTSSIGARGLTGPGYHGHVFWDTEVFALPFFFAAHPPTARGLLAYRHRLLPAARAKAAAMGYRGALYPWESADTGEEVTPPFAYGPSGERIPILTGSQEHHIAADVAWATWSYWAWTGDEDFLLTCGAEILVETARFWASRARRRRDGRLHIGKVIGPDEYHESVDDNAFTNLLARWNLERAAEIVEHLSDSRGDGREVLSRLACQSGEAERWRRVAAGLVDGFDPASGLYEQFAGYFALEDLAAAELAEPPFAADVVLGSRRLRRSQIIKQADVLMAAHMLPEALPPEVATANYRYYEPRTSHGSSLSPAIHAAVAARVGAADDALSYFHMAAGIDLGDEMGNAAQGVHMAALGGLWQAAVAGFGGARVGLDALRVDPRLPPSWRRLAFPVTFRGARVEVDVAGNTLTLSLDAPARVAVGSRPPVRLRAGRHVARRRLGEWSAPKEVALR